jgi:hypothetical protein
MSYALSGFGRLTGLARIRLGSGNFPGVATCPTRSRDLGKSARVCDPWGSANAGLGRNVYVHDLRGLLILRRDG